MIDTSVGDGGPILAVTGLIHEQRIAAAAGFVTVCGGGSPERLRTQLAAMPPIFRAVVSFGVGGGLDPTLRTGDVVIATSVAHHRSRERWATDPAVSHMLASSLDPRCGAARRAVIVGAEALLMDVDAKAAFWRATGASAVDMESHVAAEYAAAHKLPLAALRVICDPAGRALPPLAREALGPQGKIDMRAVIRSLARRPGQLAILGRTARDFGTALAALRRCRPLFGAFPVLPDTGEFVLDVA
jgi:hopanoid-associated phosphorylase